MAYLRKRGNKWYYSIEVGNGKKRKRIERPGGRTKKEAQKAMAEAIAQINADGDFFEAPRLTVDECFQEYLDDLRRRVRETTAYGYKSIYKIYISPVIGGRRLSTIRPKALQDILNATERSKSTLNGIYTVLRGLFSYAMFCEYIRTNPAQNIHMPKAQVPLKKVHAFTPEQMEILLQHFTLGYRPHFPMLISYHTGMRRGEIAALKWEDVDLDTRTIRIHATVARNFSGGQFYQPSTKSDAGIREIDIGAKLVQILKSCHKMQTADRLQYGQFWKDTGFVCTEPDGRPLSMIAFSEFNAFCREQFGAGYTFHSLRHTHATMLLEAGEDLEMVSKRLGHANISTTANVYSHILKKRRGQLRDLLDEIL